MDIFYQNTVLLIGNLFCYYLDLLVSDPLSFSEARSDALDTSFGYMAGFIGFFYNETIFPSWFSLSFTWFLGVWFLSVCVKLWYRFLDLIPGAR